MNEKLFDFIKNSPTAYHAVGSICSSLDGEGFVRLEEGDSWRLEDGGKYYVTRNLSSVIAFVMPRGDAEGFMIAASHSDSPMFKVKDHAEICDGNFVRLSTEKYGGMLAATWLDRPLSVAGRIMVKDGGGVRTALVDLERPVCIIPSVAIHMNRNANENASYNPAVDLVPLAGVGKDFSLMDEVASLAGVSVNDILSHDLFVYNPEYGTAIHGAISAPRLDDLECAFASTEAVKCAAPRRAVALSCVFDNEEVGSATKQGAGSGFLVDVLRRITIALGKSEEEFLRMLPHSMMASCDNAHALHPNHPEYVDKNNAVKMNGGIVIKYNANQRYTTDAVSSALFKIVCEKAGVPTQSYANRSDIPGGSTLGAIATTKVAVNTIDIGLAQLSMHSCYETAGARDLEYLVSALSEFFSSSIVQSGDGRYTIE